MKPSYRTPYFYLHNVNTDNNFPTKDNQVNIDHIVTQYEITNTTSAIAPSSTIIINGVTITFQTTIGSDVTIPTIYIETTPTSADVRIGINSTATINNLYTYLVETQNILLNEATYELNTIATGIKKITVIPNISSFSITDSTTLSLNILSSYIEKVKYAEQRYGNHSKVRMEIRYGKDSSLFLLDKVYVDYLKAPQFIRLTQDQVDAVEDNSQVLEFPDYICYELINEIVHLIMENASDPRLQSHIPINQSIAPPQGQQPQRK